MYILDCSEAAEMCRNLQPFLNIIKVLINVLQWSIPILLIVFGTIDMFNAVTKSEDEKAVQDARNRLIKRIIYGVVVFLIPFIVNLIMELVDESIDNKDTVTATTWVSCWNESIDVKDCLDIYAPEKEKTNSDQENVNDDDSANNEDLSAKCYDYQCKVGNKQGNQCINNITKPSDKSCNNACGNNAISYSEYFSTNGTSMCQCIYETVKVEVSCN